MRYRLRTLFILTTVVAALMAIGNEVRLRRELARQTLFTDCFRSLSGRGAAIGGEPHPLTTSWWDKYRFMWDPYAWLASLNGFSRGIVDESEEWVQSARTGITYSSGGDFFPHDARTRAYASCYQAGRRVTFYLAMGIQLQIAEAYEPGTIKLLDEVKRRLSNGLESKRSAVKPATVPE